LDSPSIIRSQKMKVCSRRSASRGAGCRTSWKSSTLIFTLVVEQGALQRVSLGYIPPGGDEDDMVAFSEEELAQVLDEKQDALIQFFEKVTEG
jgi:hypothetical protein